MEQLTTEMGVPVLRSEAESKTRLLSSGRKAIRQPGWPGDSKRTGSSSRQPEFEVVCIEMHRWNDSGPLFIEFSARYSTGVRRRVRFEDAKKAEKFLEKRTTSNTWVILSLEVIRLYSWVLNTDEGQRFAEAFDWNVCSTIKRALRKNFILPSI